MSYKGQIHSRRFSLIKFKEHRFALSPGIALLIFITMSQNLPMNCDLGLRKDVWKNENLSGGFPSEAFV